MTKVARVFLVYFTLLSLAVIFSTQLHITAFYYALKPLLVISLWVYYYYQTRLVSTSQTTVFLIALVFACLGDTLLMFQSQNSMYFLLGLAAFLVMQVLYTIVFWRSTPNVSLAKSNFRNDLWILALVIFLSSFILPKVEGFMRIAVMLYMIAIGLMVTAAWHRRVLASRLSYVLVFVGALSFMLSDSFIAFNKFVWPGAGFDFWVMPTYVLGQYLIVEGMCRSKSEISFNKD
jgi:uncharacterized membrane protein YhhN